LEFPIAQKSSKELVTFSVENSVKFSEFGVGFIAVEEF
jgi:hypothetical protein